MGNKNMGDFGGFDFILSQLDLCAFSTIYQKKLLPKSNDLGSVISSMHRDGRGVS